MSAADGAILTVEGLSVALPKGADRKRAVDDVSLEVRRGEILCVVGESGSGKSVLAAAIMGAVPSGLRVVAGSVRFDGRDLTHAPERTLRAIRGNRIAMIFQEPMAALNPAMRIGKQVEEVFELHASLDEAERRRRVLALLSETQLPDPPRIAASFPHQLSGGQCQRVVIAMALAMNPALLIADEPTTALDVTTQAQILKLIRELRDQHGHGVLFVTHDFGVVHDIADRIAVMRGGKLVEIGAAAEVLSQPRHPYTRRLLEAVPSLKPKRTTPAGELPPVLRVEGLSKMFAGGVRAVHEVSIQTPRALTLSIVGESGSGKSTLAKTIIRLIEPSSGRVWIQDIDFANLSRAELAKRRRMIQMIFQDPYGSLNPRRRVGSVIARAASLRGLDATAAWLRAAELLELVGLKREALHRLPQQFSGGQRQRIGIARALAMDPDIVIADESVSALDVSVQRQVLKLIDDLQRKNGMTILFITHDLRVAAEISDYIAVMSKGEVVEFGTAETVLGNPSHPYTRQLIGAAPGRDWTPPRPDESRIGPA